MYRNLPLASLNSLRFKEHFYISRVSQYWVYIVIFDNGLMQSRLKSRKPVFNFLGEKCMISPVRYMVTAYPDLPQYQRQGVSFTWNLCNSNPPELNSRLVQYNNYKENFKKLKLLQSLPCSHFLIWWGGELYNNTKKAPKKTSTSTFMTKQR